MARSVDVTRYGFDIAETWDGKPAPPGEAAQLDFEIHSAPGRAEIRIDAPFGSDPKPEARAGRLDGLWQFEVVELFLLGENDRYLELEFGPHGHWLGLAFQGERRPDLDAQAALGDDLGMAFAASIHDESWLGHAAIPIDWLPPGLYAANAFRIQGVGSSRRYFATHGAPGARPDFHQLAAFAPLERHCRHCPSAEGQRGARRGPETDA